MKSTIEMPTKELDNVSLTITLTQPAIDWKRLIEELGDVETVNSSGISDLKSHIRAAIDRYMRLANSEIDISGYRARTIEDSSE